MEQRDGQGCHNPPCPLKVVGLTTALLPCKFDQYTLLDWLADVEAQSKPIDDTIVVNEPAKPIDDTIVVNEPAKPVAGSSKHPNDMDVVDGELIY